MPYILKPNEFFARDPNNTRGYLPQNVIATQTADEQIEMVEAAGASTIAAVQQAVSDSQAAVASIDSQRDTMIAAIASVAGQGTDSTLSQTGVAADAAACGDLKSAIDYSTYLENNGAFTFTADDLELGRWVRTTKTAGDTRGRSKYLLPVRKGMQVFYTNATFDLYFGITETETSDSYLQVSDWLTVSSGFFNIEYDGYLSLTIRNHSDYSAVIDIASYDSVATIITGLGKTKDAIGIIDLSTLSWELGEINSSGKNSSSNYNLRSSYFAVDDKKRTMAFLRDFPARENVTEWAWYVYEYTTQDYTGYLSPYTVVSKDITLKSETKYIRFVLRASPANTIVPNLDDYKYVSGWYTGNVIDIISGYRVSGLKDLLRTNMVVGMTSHTPDIKQDGTDFNIFIRGYTRAVWSNGNVVSASAPSGTAIVLHNAETLVYDPTTNSYSVVSVTAINQQPNYCVTLLANYNGALYGQWAMYYYVDIMPYYYKTHLEGKETSINANSMLLEKRSGRFFFVTDYHITQNARMSAKLIRYLGDKCGIKKTVFGGDSIQSYTTATAGYDGLCEFVDDFSCVQDNQNLYCIKGNHEENNPSANPDYASRMVSIGAIYRLFNDQMCGVVNLGDSVNSFFYDDTTSAIRYYFIGCEYNAVISNDTIAKFADSLHAIPEGYAVFVISHLAINTNGNLYASFTNILKLCKALNDGASVTISNVGTYDYTGDSRQFIGAISGHNHLDLYVIYDNRFPVISTTCDAYAAQLSGHYDDSRQPGTIYEQAFDVVQINLDTETPANNRIYLTRIGYGDDRTFSFGVQNAGLIT